MTKREAERIARDIERHGCTVTGYRRYTHGNDRAWWGVDAVDNATGIPFAVEDEAQWHERKFAAGYSDTTPAKTAGRPPVHGERMETRSYVLPPAMHEWVARQGSNRSDGLRNVVQQAMEQEAAEAQADAMAPTYNGGRW